MNRVVRILLVEDDAVDLMAVQRLFKSRDLGYDLETAESQAQAMQCLEASSYDLILLDHQLGDGTGLELLKHTGDTPVIFIAGKSAEEVVVQAMKMGAYDFLVKDSSMDYLSLLPLTIDRVMSRKREEDRRFCYLTELERSNAELRNFAFIASHDMKEPLRKIVSFGNRLLDKSEGLNPDAKNCAEKIQSAAKRMESLINDLLQYSTVSTQGKPFQSVDLNKVVQEVIDDLEGSINETKGVVRIEQLPVLEADPAQMRQLLQNLISNALKFHKVEQVPQIELVAKPGQKDSWDIHVTDNGIGLNEEETESIFQPFARLNGRSAFAGSGIGLAICKRIVARHNGNIEVCRSDETGSTFKVTLPTRQVC